MKKILKAVRVVPSVFILAVLGCASSQTKVIDGNEFSVEIMDTLRSPGVRVRPDFKWSKSKFKDDGLEQRVKVLIPVAKEAALNYCKAKGPSMTAVFEGRTAVLGAQTGLMSGNTPPLGIEMNFNCK